MPNKSSGFTLVEIAIVLVIIGLLLGGVLKGQELINNAKIRRVTNDLSGISTAIYAYQDRYKALPGDDSGASSRWGAGVANGDRGGTISGDFCGDPNGTAESLSFWRHLRLSGLMEGDSASSEQPQNALGGILGVQTASGPASAIEIGGLVLCTSNLTGKIAEAVDNQLDDGKPGSGSLRAYSQNKTPVARGCAVNVTRTASVANTLGYNAADDTELYTICKSV